MTSTVTLSDIEVEALMEERLSPTETIADVIHRQLSPIVERLVSNKFLTLKAQYDALPLEGRAAILATLENLTAKPVAP